MCHCLFETVGDARRGSERHWIGSSSESAFADSIFFFWRKGGRGRREDGENTTTNTDQIRPPTPPTSRQKERERERRGLIFFFTMGPSFCCICGGCIGPSGGLFLISFCCICGGGISFWRFTGGCCFSSMPFSGRGRFL